MQGLKEVEKDEWYQHYLDCPLGLPRSAKPRTEFEAQGIPGCAVKSVERLSDGPIKGAPVYHGKLKSIDGDLVVVISHAYLVPSEPWFVWTGTPAEYHSYWDCD